MALTSGQQERLRRLLEDELRKAGRTALEDGASPGELADLLAERRQALTEAERGHALTEAEHRPAPTDAQRGRTPDDAEHRPAPTEGGPGRPDDRPQPDDDGGPGQA